MRGSAPEDGREFVVAGGVKLELRRLAGEGLPILLLHEALGSASTWRDFPLRLAAATGHPVVAGSRRGFGWSDPPPAPPGLDYLDEAARETLALLDALGIERAHLHGHSDGAAIALILAAEAPARAASLVLEAPHVSTEPVTAIAIDTVRAGYESSGLGRRLARHHRDPETVFANWHRVWLDPAFQAWSIENRLTAVRCPVLVIQGARDPYFSLGQGRLIARAIPQALCLDLPQSGHAPYRDEAETVLAQTADFLVGIDERFANRAG